MICEEHHNTLMVRNIPREREDIHELRISLVIEHNFRIKGIDKVELLRMLEKNNSLKRLIQKFIFFLFDFS